MDAFSGTAASPPPPPECRETHPPQKSLSSSLSLPPFLTCTRVRGPPERSHQMPCPPAHYAAVPCVINKFITFQEGRCSLVIRTHSQDSIKRLLTPSRRVSDLRVSRPSAHNHPAAYAACHACACISRPCLPRRAADASLASDATCARSSVAGAATAPDTAAVRAGASLMRESGHALPPACQARAPPPSPPPAEAARSCGGWGAPTPADKVCACVCVLGGGGVVMCV